MPEKYLAQVFEKIGAARLKGSEHGQHEGSDRAKIAAA
jgi:hypothetical protein